MRSFSPPVTFCFAPSIRDEVLEVGFFHLEFDYPQIQPSACQVSNNDWMVLSMLVLAAPNDAWLGYDTVDGVFRSDVLARGSIRAIDPLFSEWNV